jgi:hypothetical protein
MKIAEVVKETNMKNQANLLCLIVNGKTLFE